MQIWQCAHEGDAASCRLSCADRDKNSARVPVCLPAHPLETTDDDDADADTAEEEEEDIIEGV